jgi:hypothetical protein
MGVGGQRIASAALTPGKGLVPIVQEAGWASGPVWTGAANLAPTAIRSEDRPARSESLYRLHYPDLHIRGCSIKWIIMGSGTCRILNRRSGNIVGYSAALSILPLDLAFDLTMVW